MSGLRDGLESHEPFPELADLLERGLVTVESREVLLCGTPERQAYGEYCEGWAEPGDLYGEAVGCNSCGRLLEDSEPEALHTLRVDQDAIVAMLDDIVGGRRLAGGVAWTVEGEQDDVLVVVADWSEGARWMSNRVLGGRPFVLLLVEPATTTSRLTSADWVVTESVLDVLREPSKLTEAIHHAVVRADHPRTERVLAEIHEVRSRIVHVFHGTHLVEFDDAELRVDGIQLKLPAGMQKVLGYLVDAHVDDASVGKAPDAYCVWSLGEMAEAVGLPRTAVRTQLTRFQDRLASQYTEATRRRLPVNSVLECVDSQWRLNPNCRVRRVV